MHSVTMLFVPDVEATSTWYQSFLGAESAHGGSEFEMLMSDGRLFLQLHHAEPGHHDHEVSLEPPLGHGVVLVVYVADAAVAFAKAAQMGAEVVTDLHFNETANMHEFSVRDPNGYAVMVCQSMWDAA